MSDLNGKVAIVTGATSGIGQETAFAMAEAGARLVLVGRDGARAKTTQTRCEALGTSADVLLGDLASSEFCNHVVQHTIDTAGQVDVVANIAGVIRRGNGLQTSDEDWRYVMSANVDSVFFMCRAAIKAMQNNGGSIINLGSNVGMVGCEGMPAYCASKGAVIQLTRAFALDHAKQNIRVNAVCPGAVDTPMLVSEHADPSMTRDKVHENNRSTIPQGRVPAPREIADLIVFLASDLSRHMTGTAIPIDGGYTAQ